MRKLNPSEPVVSANAVPSARKAGSKTSVKAPGARAAKHSKAVVEEPAVPSVAAPVVVTPTAATVAAPPAETVIADIEVIVPIVEEPVAAPVRIVSEEEIAKLAYCYWADRGYQGGNPQEDWERAKKALSEAALSMTATA